MSEEQLLAELRELNLPPELAEPEISSGKRISVDDYGRLFIHLVRLMQKTLPSRSGNLESTLLFSAYRMMFQAMLHAGNLEQALQRAAVYFQRLQSQGESFQITIDGDSVCCRFDFSDEGSGELQSPENFNMEQLNWLPGVTGRVLSMAMWHRLCGWFIGSHMDLTAIHMQQSASSDKRYREIFGTSIKFGSGENAFYFHRRYLDFPIVQSEKSLNTMLATYPAELFKMDAASSSIATKVRLLIGTDFEGELPGLHDVAERLYMTTPTLHRRLREESTSFQQLKDLSRKEAAIAYIENGDYTTVQLAELMGFSDSSTFHRAFKKWTGLTPQEFRDKSA